MSLKLLKLRWRIFFWAFTGKINKIHSRLQLTINQGNPNTVLIIFPADEPSFRVAYYTFRDLGKKTGRKIKFSFLHCKNQQNSIYTSGIDIIQNIFFFKNL